MIKTRAAVRHTLFGDPSPLPMMKLPTCLDVFNAFRYKQMFLHLESSIHKLVTVLALEVLEIYDNASIPTIQFDSVVIKIKRLISGVHDLEKYSDAKRTSRTFQEKYGEFSCLFDVSCCKCFDKGAREKSSCKCPQKQKIPKNEWEFWVDQHTERKMIIGSVNKVESSKVLSREKRQCRKRSIKGDCEGRVLEMSDTEGTSCEVLSEEYEEFNEDTDEYEEESILNQNRNQYPELCKAVDRCGVSNRDACLISNALLKDMKLLTSKTAIDGSKLWRQRIYWRDKAMKEHEEENKNIICLGFDGKKDSTLMNTGGCRRVEKEEHYVTVAFPGDKYIDHVMPQSSKSADIAKELMSLIHSTHSTSTLQALVCDGTNNNTGKHNGVIRNIEQSLSRPLQWLVCLLHANELPFRKLFMVVDGGETKGPKTSTGKIGAVLDFDPKNKPLVHFKPLVGKVGEIALCHQKDLSTDQLYLLRASLTVQQGYENSPYIPFLNSAQPGNLNLSRWLTKANRVLRLYMSDTKPSEALQRIVRFIVNFYAPAWFQIKCNPSCQNGAPNFFYFIQLYQHLDKQDQDIIKPVLKNNCYFAHPENILLAAVGDIDLDIRRFACGIILAARQIIDPISNTVRCFDKTTIDLNFTANSYLQLVDEIGFQHILPPLLCNVSNEDLVNNKRILFPDIPCHSQSVERAVKDVSAASTRLYGHSSRHGMVLLKKKSRKELPKINCKADFLL